MTRPRCTPLLVTLLLALVAAAGCGGDDTATAPTTTSTTTTTRASTTTGEVATDATIAPGCPAQFRLPLTADVDDDCKAMYMRSAAHDSGLELADNAPDLAQALCREITISGLFEAVVASLLGWDDGTRVSPADDHSSFLALALHVYCPEHVDDLKAMGTPTVP